MKTPYFILKDVYKETFCLRTCFKNRLILFLQLLRVSCVLQEFEYLLLEYFKGHLWGPVVISGKDGVSLQDELSVLCD
jgi:hypothetical protein